MIKYSFVYHALMNYFPAFLKLDNYKILIVGGGSVATHKLSKVLDFCSNIEIIAERYSEEMLSMIIDHKLYYKTKVYEEGDVKGYDMVIIAVDNLDLQEQIFNETRKMRTLCNAVDSVAYCDFIFPSYIKEGDLTVAISTSGTSPAIAKHLKEYLKNSIPNSLHDFLKEMKEVRSTLPKGKERMQYLNQKAREFFEPKQNNKQ